MEQRRHITASHGEESEALRFPPAFVEILVPTATAILHDERDRYRVVVGVSAKHPLPVLPGGKIECADLAGGASPKEAAARCIRRELAEELQIDRGIEPSLWRITRATERDVRIVTAATVHDAIVFGLRSPSLDELHPTQLVRACYGNPDFQFIAAVDPAQVHRSVELSEVRWLDLRDFKRGTLSAGHDEIVLAYLGQL